MALSDKENALAYCRQWALMFGTEPTRCDIVCDELDDVLDEEGTVQYGDATRYCQKYGYIVCHDAQSSESYDEDHWQLTQKGVEFIKES